MPAAEKPKATPPSRAVLRATVLLVDDEDGARRPAAERLRELGYAVLEARDGPEALRILAFERPDLLVTDVGLPNGMNGRQVAEVVRGRLAGLRLPAEPCNTVSQRCCSASLWLWCWAMMRRHQAPCLISAQTVAGVIAGFGIGIVAALLGVALS